MAEPTIVVSGLGIPESPRWHEGSLWFCNWIDWQVMAVDMEGTAEVMLTRDPASYPMGYSIDWLPAAMSCNASNSPSTGRHWR